MKGNEERAWQEWESHEFMEQVWLQERERSGSVLNCCSIRKVQQDCWRALKPKDSSEDSCGSLKWACLIPAALCHWLGAACGTEGFWVIDCRAQELDPPSVTVLGVGGLAGIFSWQLQGWERTTSAEGRRAYQKVSELPLEVHKLTTPWKVGGGGVEDSTKPTSN